MLRVVSKRSGTGLVVGSIRSAPVFDPSDDRIPVLAVERRRKPKATDSDLPVRAVPHRLAVLRGISPRRLTDLIEFPADLLPIVVFEILEIGACP